MRDIALVVRAAHDRDALSALMAGSGGFIEDVRRRVVGGDGLAACGMEEQDAWQLGAVGFIKAVRTFDAGRGVGFPTYAFRCVSNEILMALRRRRLPGVRLEGVLPGTDDSLTLADTLADDSLPEVTEVVANRIAAGAAVAAIGSLPAKHASVLRMRIAGFTQRQAAQRLGICQSYVSRIEKRARRMLGAALGEEEHTVPHIQGASGRRQYTLVADKGAFAADCESGMSREQVAAKWGMTERQVEGYCRNHKIRVPARSAPEPTALRVAIPQRREEPPARETAPLHVAPRALPAPEAPAPAPAPEGAPTPRAELSEARAYLEEEIAALESTLAQLRADLDAVVRVEALLARRSA